MDNDVLQEGEHVKCDALSFNGIVRGADAERAESGDIVYHVEVTGRAMLRRVAVAASHLKRAMPL